MSALLHEVRVDRPENEALAHRTYWYPAKQKVEQAQVDLRDAALAGEDLDNVRFRSAEGFLQDALESYYNYKHREWKRSALFAQLASELYPAQYKTAQLKARWLHISLHSQLHSPPDMLEDTISILDNLKTEFAAIGDQSGVIGCLTSCAILARSNGQIDRAHSYADTVFKVPNLQPCINLVRCSIEYSRIFAACSYRNLNANADMTMEIRLATMTMAVAHSKDTALAGAEMAKSLHLPRLRAWSLWEAGNYDFSALLVAGQSVSQQVSNFNQQTIALLSAWHVESIRLLDQALGLFTQSLDTGGTAWAWLLIARVRLSFIKLCGFSSEAFNAARQALASAQRIFGQEPEPKADSWLQSEQRNLNALTATYYSPRPQLTSIDTDVLGSFTPRPSSSTSAYIASPRLVSPLALSPTHSPMQSPAVRPLSVDPSVTSSMVEPWGYPNYSQYQ